MVKKLWFAGRRNETVLDWNFPAGCAAEKNSDVTSSVQKGDGQLLRLSKGECLLIICSTLLAASLWKQTLSLVTGFEIAFYFNRIIQSLHYFVFDVPTGSPVYFSEESLLQGSRAW